MSSSTLEVEIGEGSSLAEVKAGDKVGVTSICIWNNVACADVLGSASPREDSPERIMGLSFGIKETDSLGLVDRDTST
jgi:hypothetical protein